MIWGLLHDGHNAERRAEAVQWVNEAGRLRRDAMRCGWLNCEGQFVEAQRLADSWVRRASSLRLSRPYPSSIYNTEKVKDDDALRIDRMQRAIDLMARKDRKDRECEQAANLIDIVLNDAEGYARMETKGVTAQFGQAMGWLSVVLMLLYGTTEGAARCRA